LRFWEARQAFERAGEDNPRPKLLPTLPGLTYLIQVIEGIREEVNDSSSMPEDAYPWLSPAWDWEALSGKEEILAALEDETQELIKIKDEMDKEESYQSEATTELSAIPSKEALDRIHRYETSNVRHRYKVEKRLQELQSLRKTDGRVISGNGEDER